VGNVNGTDTCVEDDGDLSWTGAGGEFLESGATQCQTVKAGKIATFVLKDGKGCSEGAELNTDGDKCYPSTKSYCSGAGNTGKECVWEIKAPDSDDCSPPDETPDSPTSSSGTTAPGASGDPHFKTWSGEHFDYHGLCDLVLLKNHDFKSGLGMDIHIRSKKFKEWSYISNAAIRIGDDTLEVMGSTDGEGLQYWVNGVKGDSISKDTMASILPFTLSGYPVSFRRVKSRASGLTVDLGDAASINIGTWKNLVRVDMHGTTAADFGTSLGLMGSFEDGKHMARDSKTELHDNNSFGQEWQVLSSEPMLFHAVEGVQHPELCVSPSAVDVKRRLRESLITQEEAEIACSRVSPEDHDLCVFDVMATNDGDVAGAY
jgi:hypothetical protein